MLQPARISTTRPPVREITLHNKVNNRQTERYFLNMSGFTLRTGTARVPSTYELVGLLVKIIENIVEMIPNNHNLEIEHFPLHVCVK